MVLLNPQDLPQIMIIILTWNKKSYVLNLLASLERIKYSKEKIDILVVDNASTDGTVEALQQQYPDVRILQNKENLGGSGGFNSGLQWAFEQPQGKYKYYWLLDNDVVVHERALIELVSLLESTADAAVVGSTMMQLDYPWRINETGAFFDSNNGGLILNHHMREIAELKNKTIGELTRSNISLSNCLSIKYSFLDVQYVAAASLLVRTSVAQKAGLWKNFFIHYDDVDWCLRIAKLGYRVLVSLHSIIWHLSAVGKIPTWILYYDIRNALYVLQSSASKNVRRARRQFLKHSLKLALIGKHELAKLSLVAIDDFNKGRVGKKEIQLTITYRKNNELLTVLSRSRIQKILIPWTVDLLQTNHLMQSLEEVARARSSLKIDFITVRGREEKCPLPNIDYIHLPKSKMLRLLYYSRLRKKYDLVLQSDYLPLNGISFLGKEILFINHETFCLQNPPHLRNIVAITRQINRLWWMD